MDTKQWYIIAGCNGAGKTTASFTILPEILQCYQFVNADEIAKGLSPFQPEKVAFEAGRIMLQRINDLLESNITFAFETTLATKSYKEKILKAKENNYNVILLFFWLPNGKLAIARGERRVLEGGHHIDTTIIKRRYIRGIKNLFEIYVPIVDELLIFDNSTDSYNSIAEKSVNLELQITDKVKFALLKDYYNEIK